MHEADFYTRLNKNAVKCNLCPWFCKLNPGQTGNCRVRKNADGILVTLVYNKVSALAVDPIEKKPLYHFLPGSQILSVGTVGCNLHCSFCQNYHISQCSAGDFRHFRDINPEQLTATAAGIKGNTGIAYTYNEPFVFYEFMLKTAILVKEAGMKNVVVSNGYVNPEPLIKLLPYIDAFNIDLKAFDADFYKKQTKGELAPVLETLKIIAGSKAHLEITNLVIPGLNDNEKKFESMAAWIAKELGKDVPLHISRYFPCYQLNEPPTPSKTLEQFYKIASKYLFYVFTGNANENAHSSTFCPACGNLLIERNRFTVQKRNITKARECGSCGIQTDLILI